VVFDEAASRLEDVARTNYFRRQILELPV